MTRDRPRSQLHRALLEGRFAVTCELPSINGADPTPIHAYADAVRGRVHGVNCTDSSAAHPHISSQAAGRILLDRGVEPIVQFGCRDRNRIGLQADLVGAAALGARNVVLMTGDDASTGDHPEARSVWDLDSIHAIRVARILRDEGTYLSGRPLDPPPDYLVGAVANPFAPPREYRPTRLLKKLEAGAEFIQTQICFNVPALRDFMANAGDLGILERLPVLVSLFLPHSAVSIRYMRDVIPGIDVPEGVVRRIDQVPRDRQMEAGYEIALEIAGMVREVPGVSGLHLISMAGPGPALRLLDELGLSASS